MGYLNDEILDKGIKSKLISIDDKRITYYAKSEKSYSYKDPEEKVRAIVFIRLVLDYKYDRNDIDFEVKVPRRTPEDSADIVVYEENNDTQPYIVVECKKDGITDNQFNQAIEQVFGNANSLRAKYAWVVAGNTETAFDVKNFDSMERSKNVISEIPTSYGKISEYRFKKTKDKEKKNSLKIVSREELISTLEKCHQTVWQGGKLNPSDAFDEVSKILFCKLKDEKTTKSNEFYKFQIGTHEESKEVSNRIHKIYEEGKKTDANVFSEDIKLDDEIIYKTVEHLQGININGTDLDSKGIAFERFMGDFFKGKMGQYFTPRNIVYFCVQMLDISEYERVLDPACGSGGFLLHAMDTVRKKAEKDFDDTVEIFKHWHDFASQRLFGIEINEQIARVCKMNMIIHDDGHTNVISEDTLDNIDKHHELNEKFIKESFDVILTNPPFGAKVLSNEKKYLGNYILGQNGNKVRASQSTEILFIERCYEYLKEKGRMAIVLPDGILTNTTLQYVRDFIMEHFRINAIVSIPQTAFSHYGAGVKCSLLFLTKETVSEDYDIFMASAEDVGYDATGRKTDKNDLEEILKEYRRFYEKKNFKLLSELCFLIKSEKLINKRIDVNYYLNSYNFSSKYNIVELKDCTFNTGTYGANETASDYNKPNDIRYIRITDIDEYGRLKNDTLKTAKNINKKYILNDNDFLFARSGSVGKTLLYKKEMGKAIYAGYLIKYILDTSKIYPEYLFAYCQTNEYWKWIKKHERPAVQSNINAEEYSSLQFPLPPIDIQKQIADIMQEAYSKKESLEKEASELLNSINDYVLNELDIKIDDSSKKEKCFTVKYSEIKNKRIDVNFYNRTIKLINKNNMVSLNKIVDIFQGVSRNLSEYSDAKLLKVKNITLDGKINLKDTEYIKNYNDNKILQTDDIITPAIGEAVKLFKFSIFNIKNNYKYLVDNNTAVIRVKNNREILPKYLLEILRNNITKLQILKLISGGGVPFIGKYLSDIEIPIPPIEIQNKIADEATNRREKAFKLQEEAKNIIEEAKKEVESILF